RCSTVAGSLGVGGAKAVIESAVPARRQWPGGQGAAPEPRRRAHAAPNNRLVRHEVAYVSVVPIEGHHLLFCQQSPTSTCVIGNGGVRSCWDNVASPLGVATRA